MVLALVAFSLLQNGTKGENLSQFPLLWKVSLNALSSTASVDFLATFFSCNSVRNYLSFYNDLLNSANKPLTQMQPLCLLLEVNTIRYIVHKTVTTAFSSEPVPIHCVRNFLETF